MFDANADICHDEASYIFLLFDDIHAGLVVIFQLRSSSTSKPSNGSTQCDQVVWATN